MGSRTKAFKGLDKDGDNLLSFEEWAVATSDRFGAAGSTNQRLHGNVAGCDPLDTELALLDQHDAGAHGRRADGDCKAAGACAGDAERGIERARHGRIGPNRA